MSAAEAVVALRGLSLHVVALVLLIAGAQKLRGLGAFRRGLLFIPYVRPSWSYAIAYTLPFVEIALALGLLCGLRAAAPAAALLFAVFAAVAGLALHKRLAVPCNCFGAGGARLLSRGTIALNLVLIALSASAAPGPTREWELVSLATAAGLILSASVLSVLEQVLSAARHSLMETA